MRIIRQVFISEKIVILIMTLAILALIIINNYISTENSTEVFSYGLAGKIIVIDPGHGGIDVGASRGNIYEKDITLEISEKLSQQLAQAGALVIMLRENESDLAGDEYVGRIRDHKNEDLRMRVEIANESKADLFLSIHTNASPNSKWSGAQTFYKPNDEESRNTAESIQKELRGKLGNTKREIAPGNFYVLKNANMPAVMVEVGFLSNPKEAQLLTDFEYQYKLVQAIIMGLI